MTWRAVGPISDQAIGEAIADPYDRGVGEKKDVADEERQKLANSSRSLELIVIATAIVPGPVVKGRVSGKNAICIGSLSLVSAFARSWLFWSGWGSLEVKS